MNYQSSSIAGALAIVLWSGFAASSPFSPLVALVWRDAKAAPASKPDVVPGGRPSLLATPTSLARTRHTVLLKDAPLASYDGSLAGYPALSRTGAAQRERVDVNSSGARAYLSLLEQRQNAFLADASTTLGRTLAADVLLRHAVNAVILDLSDAEADALRQRADVLLVEREKQLDLLTDRGPAFIGAPSIWDGSATGGLATKGEGIVAAVLDSGINWQSPAFAATGPIDGYVHINPLGAGHYLGLCGATPPNADLGRCNDKLIGMYNFTSTSATRSATDDDGHGSHTASTVAGNQWDAPFGGGTFRISGVAPHANVIAYKVCVGSCPSSAITQAANQAVADGVVDVMNFSISGGASPWTESNSLAFLGAHDAGIFVATSAGNSGPAAGTSDHQEPWVQTVAASTHDRVLGFNLDATGPGTPPANTQGIPLRPGAPPIQQVDFYNVPLVQSPGFANGNTDGCTAYPANTFTRPYAPPADRVFADGFDPPVANPPPVGAVAVLNLDQNNSGCGSGVRQANAVAAGAVGVIFVDPFYINLGAAGNTWSMLRANWDHLAALDPSEATVSITRPARATPGTGDIVADFSSRGPRALANDQWLVKPDIAAPGVDILAAYQANVAATPNPNETALENGTSMASPHIAGAAVLLRALHPIWTPTQVKSALMLTAKTAGLVRQSGQASDPWDRGAGRVDLAAAAKAGLVLDETGANFRAANPAIGGNLATLNLPSIASATCIGPCTLARTLRRALPGVQTYTVAINGLPPGTATVAPANFTIAASGARTLTLTVQSQLLPEGQWSFGEIVLTPSSPAESTLHLPVAIKPRGPVIATNPTSLAVTSDFAQTKTLTIRNDGNPTLNWTIATNGTATMTPLDTATTGNGQQAGFYNGSARGYWWAQNFDVTAQTHVTTLRANGFTLPNTPLTTSNTPSVTFSIYADNAGVPAGAPQGFGAAPLWTYANTIGTANGITTTAGNLSLNLEAPAVAATPLDLAPGRYWLMVWPTINGQGDATAGNPLWAWRTSSASQIGAKPQLYAPWDDPTAWQSDAATPTLSAFVQGTIDCTPPTWVNASNTGGMLGYAGSATTDVTFDPVLLSAGTYKGTLCITSNAMNAPTLPVPLTLVVPNGGPIPPTLAKAFLPPAVSTGTPSRVAITLTNPSATVSTLTAPLVDALPGGLVVAADPHASTTCTGGTVTAVAGAGSFTLSSGAHLPANGSCTVVADVVAAGVGSYANTLAAGALVTSHGTNAAAATATLAVTAEPPACAIGTALEVRSTAGNTRPLGYPRIKEAFAAINDGTHQGAVDISVCGDTEEHERAPLEASGTGAASYTSVSIKPAGGAARTLNAFAPLGGPFIDLVGADNVTIDGVNAGGNSLFIANQSSQGPTNEGTATIRFINGATHNTITRTTIVGTANATFEEAVGIILFSTSDTGGGNSDNTISGNDIGPYVVFTSSPSKAIMALGSPAPNDNRGNVIDDNDIHDFFGRNGDGDATGIAIWLNNTQWTISRNRLYQTRSRNFSTAGSSYAGMRIYAPGGTFTITGNRIGFGSAAGTGTTTIGDRSLIHYFNGINVSGVSDTAVTTVADNVIGGIVQRTRGGSFTGIYSGTGLVAATGNRIGSLDGSATIVFDSNIVAVSSVIGINKTGNYPVEISNNQIGSITLQGTDTGGKFYGIFVQTNASQRATIVGNTIANVTNNQVGEYSMSGINSLVAPVTLTDNVVRNLSAKANASFSEISGISVWAETATLPSTVARNVVHSLYDSVGGNGASNGDLYGIDLRLSAQPVVVERNLVHSLWVDSPFAGFELTGLSLRSGSSFTVRNNMVRLGLDPAGNAITASHSLIGIRDTAQSGGDGGKYYHNTVYIGGSGVAAGVNTAAFTSNATPRDFRNNIFWNARSNANAGGNAHGAIMMAGSGPNPGGIESDYNVLFADGVGGAIGFYNGATVPTLAAWRAATARDGHSVAGNPQFLAANGSAATGDLHINPEAQTPVEGGGIALPSVTDDFDGQMRDGLTPTDIGADAGDFTPPLQ